MSPLKPTIRNGMWVWLPPPASDLPYLATAAGKQNDNAIQSVKGK